MEDPSVGGTSTRVQDYIQNMVGIDYIHKCRQRDLRRAVAERQEDTQSNLRAAFSQASMDPISNKGTTDQSDSDNDDYYENPAVMLANINGKIVYKYLEHRDKNGRKRDPVNSNRNPNARSRGWHI